VSAICQAIKDEYEAWGHRRLDEVTLDYLFLDASFFRMHPGSPAEPVLAAWGITTGGKPAFIGLAPGSGESADAWADFLADLNLLAKVPAGMRAEIKDAYWKLFDTEGLKTLPGPRLVELADARISEIAAKYQATYPSAMKCLLTDKEGLTAYLWFPAEHHNRVRHSNFIERTFGETRRRVKAIGRLPGETSCLTLVWAVLDRASRGWRGFTMTPGGLRLLQDLRRSLLEPPRQIRPHTATNSQPADGCETVSTVA
jgi:transposase-like protein